MKLTVRRVAAIGIGAVLFFLLGRFVVIPSPIETVNICVQYGLQAFLSVTIGPLTGALSGLLGHILIDWSCSEFCWSWIVATAAFGGLLGVLANVVRLKSARWNQDTLIRFNLCQVAVHVICWAGVAPVLEIALYGESMDRIFEQGLTAAVSNATTTAVVGTALLLAHAAIQSRSSAK